LLLLDELPLWLGGKGLRSPAPHVLQGPGLLLLLLFFFFLLLLLLMMMMLLLLLLLQGNGAVDQVVHAQDA